MERFQVPFGQGTLATNWKNPHEGVELAHFEVTKFSLQKGYRVNRESPPIWRTSFFWICYQGELLFFERWDFHNCSWVVVSKIFYFLSLPGKMIQFASSRIFFMGVGELNHQFLYVIYPMCPEKKTWAE